MATKAATRVRKKEVVKVVHNPLMKTYVRAQMASAAPPLGPMLGQRGINVVNFCKQFNAETEHIKPGVPLPTRTTLRPDRSYDLEICTPTSSWLLKQAAGIRRGVEGGEENTTERAGVISVKHVYEIALIKSRDKALHGVPLQEVCQLIVITARKMGIKVVREDLDIDKLKAFLDERRVEVAKQLQVHADKKAAKMLRTA